MDKTIAGLLGALGTLAAASAPATAAPVAMNPVMQANNYADLLKPIPNAVTLLQASDAALANEQPELVQAAYYHHHHHRNYRRRPPQRRYHHHHHHSAVIVPGAPQAV